MPRKLMVIAGVVLSALSLTTGAAAQQQPAGAKAGHADTASVKQAPRFVTRPGFAACVTRPKLDTLTMFVAERDTGAYHKLLRDPKSGCFRLKAGVEVVPLATDNLVVQIRPVGAKRTVYTVVEALKALPAQESVVRKK